MSLSLYLIFGLGLFLGACIGLIAAALLGTAHRREWPEDETARWERLKQEYEDVP